MRHALKSFLPSLARPTALLAALLVPTLGASLASAQEEAAEAESAAESGGVGIGVLTDYLADGGAAMYVILALSLIGTALFLERAFDLYVLQKLPTKSLLGKVMNAVERRRWADALNACDVRSAHPLVRVLKAGVLRADRRGKEIEQAMEKEMLEAIPKLQKRVGLMALLANAATLTGLLGTIFGLITAFNSVAAASAAERQEALAAGISQAMYTTAFGIAVALPLLFMHHFLSKRSEKIILEVEGGASALLVALAGEVDERTPPARAERGAPVMPQLAGA